SPMADPDYISKYKIRADAQGYLTSTFSYSEEELAIMKELYKHFTIADGYSVLRYLLRYLQWDHNITALDFLVGLGKFMRSDQEKYSHIRFCFRFFDVDKCLPGGWNLFFSELRSYIKENYNITESTALDSILEVNELAMPEESRTYPLEVELVHDVESYFKENNNLSVSKRPLAEYGIARFTVEDPDGTAKMDLNSAQYDSHQFFWELSSNISRAKSLLD
ncbi:MAG: hypothetical protein OQK04_01475, partial [Kangiellaceae bacterium]|nr:hypothetical protein [Kangiellaceae bacterium]